MNQPTEHFATCHPALLIERARRATVDLSPDDYTRDLQSLIDEAERIGADDPVVTDRLVRQVIESWQDAAIDQYSDVQKELLT